MKLIVSRGHKMPRHFRIRGTGEWSYDGRTETNVSFTEATRLRGGFFVGGQGAGGGYIERRAPPMLLGQLLFWDADRLIYGERTRGRQFIPRSHRMMLLLGCAFCLFVYSVLIFARSCADRCPQAKEVGPKEKQLLSLLPASSH
jgi:hypothetical protein